MKKRIFSFITVAAIVAMIMSCGKSGNHFELNVDDDGIFGKLPVITAQYKDQGVDLMKELMSTKDKEEQKEILIKTKELEDKANVEFMAAYEEIKNIEIPTEVEDNMPVKISIPFKTDPEEEAEFSEIPIIAEAELTIDQPDRFAKDFFWFTYPKAVLVDADGQPLLFLKGTNKMLPDQDFLKAGAKFKIEITVHMKLWNAELLGKAKKIVLYNEKGDAFKAIRKANNEAERAYDNRINKILNGEDIEEEEKEDD